MNSILVPVAPAVALSLLLASGYSRGEAPATAPSRTDAELVESLRSLQPRMKLLIGDPAVMSDAQKRSQIAAEAVPLIKRYKADYAELAKLRPVSQAGAAATLMQFDQTLAVLGDAEGAQNLQKAADSSDPKVATSGKTTQLVVRWMTAGGDAAAQAAVADDAEKLAHAHPESVALTVAMFNMSRSASDRATTDRLDRLATAVMNNSAVSKVKEADEQLVRAEKLNSNVGKPFTLAGTTVDGMEFSTASLIGKVVLVDFWATWCGPCRVEMPKLMQTYQSQHTNGLEFVGVSSDFAASDLTNYVAQNKVPWTQLFDPTSAAEQHMNELATAIGINKIPRLLLIDKKGVLRSADAGPDYDKLLATLLSEG